MLQSSFSAGSDNSEKFRRGAGCPFQRTAHASQGAQNLLAGCIFDGLACQKCFCVTLDKSNRTEEVLF